jgi:putative FmdB family regulatory protein
MPLYEYECTNCHHREEKLVRQSVSSENLQCPKCQQFTLTRLISVPAQVSSNSAAPLPLGGGCGVGPPCGAPWCQRKG